MAAAIDVIECRSDDDADGQVDHVATQDEAPEALHFLTP